MLTTLERVRFHELRDRQDGGEILSEQEIAEVARFVQQLEDAEAALLTPATERLRKQNADLETRIRAAQSLVVLEERFAKRWVSVRPTDY